MVEGLSLINQYFDLTEHQQWQLGQIVAQHRIIAKKQNLMSHGDIEHIWIRHILHSLALVKVVNFDTTSSVLDIGTGGGFPSMPLGVLLPEVSITAIDGRSRKTVWVRHIAEQAKCKNVMVIAKRAEDMDVTFDLITARAVAPIHKLIKWSKPLLSSSGRLFFFKGGQYQDELRLIKSPYDLIKHSLADIFESSFFKEKYILEMTLNPPDSD